MTTQPHTPNPRRKRATENPDHARRTHGPAPADAEIDQRLRELVQPAIWAEVDVYRQVGLRNRLLTLPVMVALVLTLLWRRVPGVWTLVRMLQREQLLWAPPTVVSQPARSERLLTFPAELFERILMRVLAALPARVAPRTRPLPAGVAPRAARFQGISAVDGTTLEALFRKLHTLREAPTAPLGGHLGVLVDGITHLPVKRWFVDDSARNDKAFLPDILAWLRPNQFLVFDLGSVAFSFFAALTERSCWFVTRVREKTRYAGDQVRVNRPAVRDQIIRLGC